MEHHNDSSGNFETVTYQLEDNVYEVVITNLKNNISVNGSGTTEIEAYSNALQRLEEEKDK
ncbi:hypothetical protein [Bacillus sp. B15-48]|uniref:hypothetical protein n=1 Tax=Bacillus sp. B15-48 TaxID=1548601 RepID=UPI00193ED9A1|nr:hypothetical protein [Bacillus sp. B15-48]MBM4761788.1 hypothetical protein [Bacillus sp. B15-48]